MSSRKPAAVASTSSSERKHFPNPYTQMSQDPASSDVVQNGKLTTLFCELLKRNIQHLVGEMDAGLKGDSDASDQSVYTGVTGVALLYLHLHQVLEDDAYLGKCYETVERPLRHPKGRRLTFMCGDAGPLAVGALVFQRMGRTNDVQDCIKKLHKLHAAVLDPDLPDELLYGRSGYLFSLLLLQRHLGREAIQEDIVDKVCRSILDSGQELSRRERSPSPLMFEWHGKKYIGAAHGMAGILMLLMQAQSPSVLESLQTLIRPTVDYLLGLRFPSGNFPSSLGNESDRLVHWCHGAPGVVHMLLQAHKVFGGDKYLQGAVGCGEVIWERGLLCKGYGLCHGTAGNAYAFLGLYQATSEDKYLHMAAKFAEWCFDYGKHGCRIADRPYSLMEGMAGTVYFLSDLLKPLEARFPGLYVT